MREINMDSLADLLVDVNKGYRSHLSNIKQHKEYMQWKHRIELSNIERKGIQGLKQFVIDGKIVWALNQKNAERKARKQPV